MRGRKLHLLFVILLHRGLFSDLRYFQTWEFAVTKFFIAVRCSIDRAASWLPPGLHFSYDI